MFGNVSNSRNMNPLSEVNNKKRSISEVDGDCEDRVGGLASPTFKMMEKDVSADRLLKKMKTTEMADTDETMEITDPRAEGLITAIRDNGLEKVQQEVNSHNKTNEMIIKVVTAILSVDPTTPIFQSLNPEVRDANFYGIGLQNAVKILNFVQEIEVQFPGSSQQFANEILNPPVETEASNSEALLIGMVDFAEEITQALENFSW